MALSLTGLTKTLNMPSLKLLDEDTWQSLERAHSARAEIYTKDHLARRKVNEKHPVFDFLFEYYPIRAAHLHRWHPGVGTILDGSPDHQTWKYYHRTSEGVTIDIDSLWEKRAKTFLYIKDLLSRTNTNPVHFDCFGLHEWAMVYKSNNPRHDLPLRLGSEGTNQVVEANNLKCTHFDAYRFFTQPAVPLNFTVLSRDDQPANDQRGCLHATMDLYKWAGKLGPLVPGDLWLDTFELAWDARILDMEASPYDCRAYGLGVVAIETPEGKAEYVARQRALSERAAPLRDRLVATIDKAKALHSVGTSVN